MDGHLSAPDKVLSLENTCPLLPSFLIFKEKLEIQLFMGKVLMSNMLCRPSCVAYGPSDEAPVEWSSLLGSKGCEDRDTSLPCSLSYSVYSAYHGV